jgi:tRNA U55 pseudouridine synthase TruB
MGGAFPRAGHGDPGSTPEAAELSDEALDRLVLPLSAGVADLPALHFDDSASLAVSQGRQIDWPTDTSRERSAAFASDGRLLALIDCDEQGRVRILRGFNLPVQFRESLNAPRDGLVAMRSGSVQ